MRAGYVRQGAAWEAWARLRDSVVLQINSSDLNPMVIVGASPTDSWELSTPQMMRYYVKGGPLSHGQHGFVFSTANWDPYPLANDIEAFTNAVANMDIAIAQRIAIEHDGELALLPREAGSGQGAVFRLRLPVAGPPLVTEDLTSSDAPAVGDAG